MDDRYVIPSVDRAFAVLGILAEAHKSLSLAELGRITGIPKSTLFRILATLRKHHCIIEEENRKFRIGARLWELGSAFVEQFEVYHHAVRYMRNVAEASGETVFLGSVEEGEVVYTRRVESPISITAVKKLGTRAPVHGTATGMAILAFMPEADVAAFLSQFEPIEARAIRAEIQQIVHDGYAVVDGEHNPELLCVSAPVFDHTRRPQASITVAMLSNSPNVRDRVPEVGKLVRDAARELSAEMGYKVIQRSVLSDRFRKTAIS